MVCRLGGGIPSDIPGKGSGRKSHTPSGQSRIGGADLRASPLAFGPLHVKHVKHGSFDMVGISEDYQNHTFQAIVKVDPYI